MWSSYALLAKPKNNYKNYYNPKHVKKAKRIVSSAAISSIKSSMVYKNSFNSISTEQLESLIHREEHQQTTLSKEDREQLRRSMQVVEALRHIPGLDISDRDDDDDDNHFYIGGDNEDHHNETSHTTGNAVSNTHVVATTSSNKNHDSKFYKSNFKQSMDFLNAICTEVMVEEEGEEEEEKVEQQHHDVDDEYFIPLNDSYDNEDNNNNKNNNSHGVIHHGHSWDSRGSLASLLLQPTDEKIKLRLKNLQQNSRKSMDKAHGTLNLNQAILRRDSVFNIVMQKDTMHIEDISYVRKPKLSKLAQLAMTKKFHRYKHRYLNSQRNRTLDYPTLKQPQEDGDTKYNQTTELVQSRERHRFIITADTQFGILMDGFAMEEPSWKYEVELSRKTVEMINAMSGPERPLFVCVCGDLVDTESSFSTAMASWKKVFQSWQRHLVFEQQCKDWKDVWSHLDDDIALVCLCGNHDVGNRPTQASIETWTSIFGDDYLAFWVNGTYNIGLNNCLFSNPTGAPELFDEQLSWLEERLRYARENSAKQIFVYSHFPWFITHEDEQDEDMDSASLAPEGWGPSGTKFSDFYFNVPIETRQMALSLFKEYNVTACFSGHFHQNVVTQTSWGMPMIITGPLSMTLKSTIQNKFNTPLNQQCNGFRTVDCDPKRATFRHAFVPIDETDLKNNPERFYCQRINNTYTTATPPAVATSISTPTVTTAAATSVA